MTVSMCLFLTTWLVAQGMLPGTKEKAPPPAKPAHSYLLIGETVPKTLSVIDRNGKPRSLLSYKSATDILVLGIYSPRCSANLQLWPSLKRIYDDYKDWHASFLALSVNTDETAEELQEALTHAKLPYPVARDDQQRAVRLLHATNLPEVLIIDEWGQLKYRGPADSRTLRDALNTIIGHSDALANPEPQTWPGCPIQ
jgi:hypothetical protein